MKLRKTPTHDFDRHKFLIALLIFFFALSLRLWHLTANGRAWDEGESAQINYKFGQLIRTGDFANPYWWHYVPDHPRLVRYLYSTVNWMDVDHFDKNDQPVFRYDLTASRTLAAVIASLTVLLVTLYGFRYFSSLTAITSGITLAMLPVFLGHSQISMFEPFIIFFFTAAVFSYTELLVTPSKRLLILTGIFTGLAVAIKETNLLLFPLFVGQYYATFFFSKKKIQLFSKDILTILFISFIVFVIHWPMIWFHLDYIIAFTYKLRVAGTGGIPELLFGNLHRTTIFHYLIYFLTTTPIIVLAFFFTGLWKSIKTKQWLYISLLLWFVIPFLQSFYPKREQGIRYIIEMYAPLALLTGIGFEYLVTKVVKKQLYKLLLFIPVILYFFIILYRVSPYYLDYFNILVGGSKTVYEKRLLHFGWWGDGIKEGAEYIRLHAKKDDSIGLAISPSHTLPPLPGLSLSSYSPTKRYTYVMVNTYHIIRDNFDDTEIKRDYTLLKTVKADGAVLVSIYKTK